MRNAGRRGIILLMGIMLLWGCLGGAWAESAGKWEASPAILPDILTGVIYAGEGCTGAVAQPTLQNSMGGREPLIACDIQLIGGSAVYQNLYTFVPETGMILMTPVYDAAGEAPLFLVRMESEHATLTARVAPVVLPRESAWITTGGEALTVPVERELAIHELLLTSGWLAESGAVSGYALLTADQREVASTAAYTLDSSRGTLRFAAEGEYTFFVRASLGVNRLEMTLPLTLRATKDTARVSLSGSARRYNAFGTAEPVEREESAAAVLDPAEAIHPEVFLAAEMEQQHQVIFTLPVPANFTVQNQSGEETDANRNDWIIYEDAGQNNFVYANVLSMKNTYTEDPDTIRSIYRDALSSVAGDILWQGEILLDGDHPAYAVASSRVISRGENQISSMDVMVRLWYMRGSSYLRMYYEMTSVPGLSVYLGNMPSAADFLPILSAVSYVIPENREGLPEWLLTPESYEATIIAPEGQTAIAAGHDLELEHTFRDQAILDEKPEAFRRLYWYLVDSESYHGEEETKQTEVQGLTIDQQGKVHSPINLTDQVRVTAVARCLVTGEESAIDLVLLPRMTGLQLEDEGTTLNLGQTFFSTLKVSGTPEGALLFNGTYDPVTWKAEPEGVVDLLNDRSGTVTLMPLKPGKVTISVTDKATGRTNRRTYTVQLPVKSLEIAGPDEIVRGRTEKYDAIITPEDATDQRITWSVNVDKKIATITAAGKLTVKKSASSGTEIIITCVTAGDQPEVVAEKTVTVK